MQFAVNANVVISLACASLYALVAIKLYQSINWQYFFYCFFSCFTIYNVLRLMGSHKSHDSSELAIYVNQNKRILYVVTFVSMLITVTLFIINLNHMRWWAIAFSAILLIFYMNPFRAWLKSFKGLRNFLLTKTWVVGLVWGIMCVLIPKEHHISSAQVLCAFVFVSLLIWSLTILFDIKDAVADLQYHTPNMFNHFGLKNTQLAAWIILLAAFIFAFLSNQYPPNYSFIAIDVVFFLIFSAMIYKVKTDSSEMFYLFGMDGMIALYGITYILLDCFI